MSPNVCQLCPRSVHFGEGPRSGGECPFSIKDQKHKPSSVSRPLSGGIQLRLRHALNASTQGRQTTPREDQRTLISLPSASRWNPALPPARKQPPREAQRLSSVIRPHPSSSPHKPSSRNQPGASPISSLFLP